LGKPEEVFFRGFVHPARAGRRERKAAKVSLRLCAHLATLRETLYFNTHLIP